MKVKLNKTIGIIAGVIVLAVAVFLIFRFFRLSFTALLMGAIMILAFNLWYYYIDGRGENMLSDRYNYGNHIVLGLFSVLAIGLLSIITLTNYFSPSSRLYSNNDHYALNVQGIKIERFPYTLIDERHPSGAFFDAHSYLGRLSANRVDATDDNGASSVVMNSSGNQRPIFVWKERIGRHANRKVLNERAFIHFVAGDKLVFSYKNGNSFSFRMEEHTDGKRKDWTTDCFVNADKKVNVSFVLNDGCALSSLLNGIVIPSDCPVDGINIIRTETPDWNYNNSKKIRLPGLENKKRAQRIARIPFILDFSDEALAKLSSVSVNGQTYGLGKEKTFSADLLMPVGKVFSIGYGRDRSPYMYFDGNRDSLCLNFDQPLYRYLTCPSDRQDNTVLVANSLMENGKLIAGIPEDIILYELFKTNDNVNSMRPWCLSFSKGEAVAPLVVTVDGDSSRTYTDGELFDGIKGRGNNVTWNASIIDFAFSSPISGRMIIWIVIVLTMVSALWLWMGAASSCTSLVEPFVYSVLIVLVSIRLFLCWRIAAFPPVSSITAAEFAGFRKYEIIIWIIAALSVFYLTILVVKIIYMCRRGGRRISNIRPFRDLGGFLYYIKIKLEATRQGQFLERHFAVLCSPCVLILVLLSVGIGYSVGALNRIGYILCPIVLYMGGEYLLVSHTDYGAYSFWRLNINFIMSVCLAFAISGILFIADGGYGTMFLLFSLFYLYIRLVFHLNRLPRQRFANPILWLILFAIFGFAFRYRYLLSPVVSLNASPFFYLLHAVLVSAVVLAVYYLIGGPLRIERVGDYRLKTLRLPKYKALPLWILVTVIFVVIAFVTRPLISSYVNEHPHMQYRVLALDKPEDDVFKLNIPDNKSEAKFLQASMNDWILEEYNQKGDDIKLWGTDRYFRPLPQSKLGALWFAQTTDICIARYVIAEHGKLMAITLVTLFFLLFLAMFAIRTRRKNHKLLIMSGGLLLFVQALMVWLANTRNFVFFGQDFPMISITSKLSILLFIILALISSVASISDWSSDSYDYEGEENSKSFTRWMSVMYAVLFVALIGIYATAERTYGSEYNLNNLLSENTAGGFNDKISKINELFADYQDRNQVNYPDGNDYSRVVKAFYDADSLSINNILSYGEDRFTPRAFRNFIYRDSKVNRSENLLHIVRYDRRNIKGYTESSLQIAVKSDYYDAKLPNYLKTTWEGDVLSSSSSTPQPNLSSSGYRLKELPAGWTREPMALVSSASSVSFDIRGTLPPITLGRGGLPVVAVDARDAIGGKPLYSSKDVIAQNVNINGTRTFVYPMNDEFYWAKTFAETVSQANHKDKEEDVYLTVDVPLVSQLKRKIQSFSSNPDFYMSVIVADGDGKIRAFADYKDKKHQLNPNDWNRIAEIREELSLRMSRSEERRYFSNEAFLELKDGPGSSQKPLVYSAVTSGISTIDWTALCSTNPSFFYNRYPSSVNDNKGGFPFFNGHETRPFTTVLGDEVWNQDGVNAVQYIAKSSNYYNAMVAYIGSRYSVGDDVRASELFRSVEAPNRMSDEEYKKNFPVMKYRGRFVSFVDTLPSVSSSSILHDRLARNFNLPAEPQYTYQHSIRRRLNVENLYERLLPNVTSGYVYPEFSYLDLKMRNELYSTTYPTYLENMVRKTATGQKYVWHVTPAKMAQMFGSLISMNRLYRLTLDPERELEYERFTTWDNESEYVSKVQNQILQGMSDIFKYGTLRSMRLPSGYHYYAKTGTIDGQKRVGRKLQRTQSQLLGIVISDKDLRQADPKDVRMFVMYIEKNAFYSLAGDDRAQLVETVVNSKVFRDYMNSKK